jgi:IclR family transcriptional regulator, KDG regulon repressor
VSDNVHNIAGKPARLRERRAGTGEIVPHRERTSYIIKTVLHALDILEQFDPNVNELGVTELSKRLKLHKNNVFRLLATLESRNFIEQNTFTQNYRLGMKNLELGQTVLRQLGVHRQSRPLLESLAAECDETSYLAIRRGAHIIYLDAVETSQPVRVVPRTGILLPAWCTAAGKVLLAATSDQELHHFLSTVELRPQAPRSITRRDDLKQQLAAVSAQGYALEDEELDVGVRGVAVALRDYSGSVVGAICVSGPAIRFSSQRLDQELIPLVRKAADEVSRRMGYTPPAIAAN